MDFSCWLKSLVEPASKSDWGQIRFVTRAKTLFYARLALLAVGLGILAVPRWAHAFGAEGAGAFIWYFVMIVYSIVAFVLVERGMLGKAVCFVTLCLDLLVLVYMITYSGGLRSPVLPTQVVYTIFFALLFPSPMAILPPLLTLPVVAKIDTELPLRVLELEDIFLLVWYSAVNFIVVYVIVYLNEREESQHNEIVSLQENLRHLAVAEERNRLSREIHDGLGASLSSLIIQAEYLNNLAREPALKGEISELKETAEESIDELRRSISMLRDDFDLVPSFEEYCIHFGQRAGIEVEVDVRGKIPRLDAELQLAAFRVLQEALTNVRKHAKASRVQVELLHVEDRLRLTVSDDGRGFDFKGNLQGHYGLANMRERARHYGGKVEIDSQAGNGCRISFEIPVGSEHRRPQVATGEPALRGVTHGTDTGPGG